MVSFACRYYPSIEASWPLQTFIYYRIPVKRKRNSGHEYQISSYLLVSLQNQRISSERLIYQVKGRYIRTQSHHQPTPIVKSRPSSINTKSWSWVYQQIMIELCAVIRTRATTRRNAKTLSERAVKNGNRIGFASLAQGL